MTDTSPSIVDKVYARVRKMAITYELKPGERLNEGQLSRQLGVSRTPLREALNRLNTEGFLSFEPGKGFFCRLLDPKDIFDLYEIRKMIEVSAIPLSAKRAKIEDIEKLETFLDQTGPGADDMTTEDMVHLDEMFHERLLALANNDEMVRLLKSINARIHFVRYLDFGADQRPQSQAEHRLILKYLREKNVDECVNVLERHIDRRMDRITDVVRAGIADLYLRKN